MKTTKTNAMRLLEKLGIPYTPHEYATSDGALDGLSVAHKTGRNPASVFKTLLTRGAGGGHFVFCIPVGEELHLKSAALAAGEKKIEMLPLAGLFALTGYHKGGCSPLGMKKSFPTFLEASAQKQSAILVSAGLVGLQIELAPAGLLQAANAAWFTNA